MKYKIIFLVFLTGILSCSKSQETAGQKRFLHHLNVIESYLDNRPDSTLSHTKSIDFLERNTGIESSADGTFIGKLTVQKKDFERWKKWYDENKDDIKLQGELVPIK